MDKKNDGGSAAFGHCAENGHCCGLTKRQWYAGMAMQGLLSNPNAKPKLEIPSASFTVADALIKHEQEDQA